MACCRMVAYTLRPAVWRVARSQYTCAGANEWNACMDMKIVHYRPSVYPSVHPSAHGVYLSINPFIHSYVNP